MASCIKRIPETGDLLLIWNNALPKGHYPAYPRNPLCCAISKDEGQTWENVKDIENRVGYQNAYPSVTILDDEALVTYYANVRSGTAAIVSEVKLKIYPLTWFYTA